jgi:DNA recombination protein RmuC
VAGLVAALTGGGKRRVQEMEEQAARRAQELETRIKSLVEQQAASQQQTSNTLRNQERAIAEALDKRLGEFSKRLGDSLNQTSQTQQKSLTELRERLATIDAAQKNITELSGKVVSLQELLSNKQARGAFGEEQLEAIVRDQLPPGHYDFQSTLSNGTRVDCLIKIDPPLGPLAIDAKFPREQYDALRDLAPEDKEGHDRALRAFGVAIAKHIKDISTKYIIAGETAEAALMFIPSEAVYAEIYDKLPSVADDARRARVFIVSPTTLWAVLNTMRAVMKDVRMREQAHLIQREVGTLLEDIGRLDERVNNLDRHFNMAVKDIREIQTSTGKISKRGERIMEMELEESESGGENLEGPADRLDFSKSD